MVALISNSEWLESDFFIQHDGTYRWIAHFKKEMDRHHVGVILYYAWHIHRKVCGFLSSCASQDELPFFLVFVLYFLNVIYWRKKMNQGNERNRWDVSMMQIVKLLEIQRNLQFFLLVYYITLHCSSGRNRRWLTAFSNRALWFCLIGCVESSHSCVHCCLTDPNAHQVYSCC